VSLFLSIKKSKLSFDISSPADQYEEFKMRKHCEKPRNDSPLKGFVGLQQHLSISLLYQKKYSSNLFGSLRKIPKHKSSMPEQPP
jgi:hypothetical protein